METKTFLNYINGKWIASTSGEVSASFNPANQEEVVGYYQMSNINDLDAAVTSANQAKRGWRNLSGAARGDYLFKVANIMERRLDEIALCMTREMGKTYSEAKGETARGIAILRYYAGEGMRKVGDVIPSTDSSALMYSTRCPLGVIGVIPPWNFPVAIPLWKSAPALIYGNTVILKPAEESAITAAMVVECFDEAGFPNGVINMVNGKGTVIGQGMVEHPLIQGITFTGSNLVGKMIGQIALARGAKYQLEMGGKNPIIVAADADIDLAVDATISGGFRSTGQKCTATSRVIVLKEIYDSFKQRLLAKTAEINVGNGQSQDVWMGPCASEKQLNTVIQKIKQGIEEGATLLTGGARLNAGILKKGFFLEPTIFEGVTSNMTLAKEEIFGPVLALISVNNMEEAIELANDVEYGLSASIFTKDIGNILNFINDIDAGLVRINSETAGVELQAPFGGMKQSSSHSREQGQAAIEFFTSIKTVFIKA